MPGSERGDLGNVAALLELCDAQQNVIDRLQRAIEEHEEANADRRMLRRMLAHELRTPLTAIIGTLHTLALPKLSEEKHADLRTKALRQAEQLNELIDDILHLADPHEPSVDRTPLQVIGLADLLDDVVVQIGAEVPAERLVVEVAEDCALRTVPGRVRQILVNLVVNAAKYSPEGSPVRVTATRLADRVCFEIVDEGCGVDPAVVESMFEAFQRGNHREVDGVGLGLYLVRNLVRSLGGTIQLSPREGGGTLARVELPQKRLEDVGVRAPSRHLHALP
ncbi:MAG: HAMP domain-containing histidine kinase [Actinobacteria bacterium]|nr:HAMP domain-containing histidine kinase [Actinomycetota bacterium]